MTNIQHIVILKWLNKQKELQNGYVKYSQTEISILAIHLKNAYAKQDIKNAGCDALLGWCRKAIKHNCIYWCMLTGFTIMDNSIGTYKIKLCALL